MTREEREAAIAYIKCYRKLDEDLHNTSPKDSISYYATDKCLKYWDMAIQALEQNESAEEWYKLFVKKLDEQEPTDENLHREREQAYMQGYEDASKRFRQEPCDTYTEGYFKGYDDGLEQKLEEPCEDIAQGRYKDLCEYFGDAKDILKSREDFKAWLERVKWHIRKAEELYEKYEYKKEPCDDAISREVAIRAIKNLYPDIPRVDFNGAKRKWADKYAQYIECERLIEQLPSVTQKSGKWKSTIDGKPIFSECGFVSESEDGYFVSHYCPNYGAKMESEEEQCGK